MSAAVDRRVPTFGGLIGSIGVVLLMLLVAAAAALSIGPESTTPADILSTLLSADHGTGLGVIVFEIRLPRILLAMSAGAALACTGALFQALLRNPLAEPYILGVSNGGAIGAILGFILGVGAFLQPAFAFAGSAVVVGIVLGIARGSYGLRSESMLLGGAMVAAIGAALIFLLLHLVGPQLRSAIQWMLGDLGSARSGIGYASGVLFVSLFAASLGVGNVLNALALGDEEAASLGVNVPRARAVAYLAGSFVVGVTVSFCGAIGFVGLVVPHIVRRIVGADHRVMLPVTALAGALFLLVCDTLARSLMQAIDSTGSELPVGAVTALVGAPLFIYLLRRGASQG